MLISLVGSNSHGHGISRGHQAPVLPSVLGKYISLVSASNLKESYRAYRQIRSPTKSILADARSKSWMFSRVTLIFLIAFSIDMHQPRQSNAPAITKIGSHGMELIDFLLQSSWTCKKHTYAFQTSARPPPK
jgi:hypothetical protein